MTVWTVVGLVALALGVTSVAGLIVGWLIRRVSLPAMADDPAVPFPRTVPDDAPQPPAPLLDPRAAWGLFSKRQADRAGQEVTPVAFRMADEGVYVRTSDGSTTLVDWDDARRQAHQWGDPTIGTR